jgi:asparagine synthase (glutamine-hydrolysing)
MCGIAGFVAASELPLAMHMLEPVLQRLRHRGLDDEGVLAIGADGETKDGRFAALSGEEAVLCAIAHRRLSILDTSAAGHQPMLDSEGRFALVLNGEIYNYVELRTELVKLGHAFRTSSDTEVLLAAWREWGRAALPRLIGMFAFAVLDRVAETLTLARDVFGIKPLYVAHHAGAVFFASEIGALLSIPGCRWRLDAQKAFDYLCLGLTDHGGETLVEGISSLKAGSLLEIPIGSPHAAAAAIWAQVRLSEPVAMGFDVAAERIRTLFLDSVRLHLRSDVPLGVALSGGVDSSSTAMAMRHILGDDVPITAFGYVAGKGAPTEERWMDEVARAGNFDLIKIRIGGEDFVRDLDRLILAQDQPTATTSVYAQYQVFAAAAGHGIKVMLDGQGADEYLAGYPTFAAARLASILGSLQFGEALPFLARAASSSGLGILGMVLRTGRFFAPPLLTGGIRALVGVGGAPSWLVKDWFYSRNAHSYREPAIPGGRKMAGYLRECLVCRSLPALLRHADRNSMAHSVESRVPFLTMDLVEFALSLPEEFLLDRVGVTKAVFRYAMRGLVPDSVLDRRDKVGFVTPQGDWLLRHASAFEPILAQAAKLPFVAAGKLQKTWRHHVSEGGQLPGDLWRIANLSRWVELNGIVVDE